MIDLVDRLNKNVNLFYEGCIILEIRDHRRSKSLLINSIATVYRNIIS